MANELKERMNGHAALAMDDALEGARRATGNASSIAPPPDPEVAVTARRRQFDSADRQRILAAADGCNAAGEIGALLRREGIYSSQLATWRKQRAAAERAALAPKKRGRKADLGLAEARRMDQRVEADAEWRSVFGPRMALPGRCEQLSITANTCRWQLRLDFSRHGAGNGRFMAMNFEPALA